MRCVVAAATAAVLCCSFAWLGCTRQRTAPASPAATVVQARFTQLVMASPMRITIDAPDAQQARHAASAGFTRALEVETALSDWQPDSAVSRLPWNANEPTVVTGDLALALERSSAVWYATEGAFDPALGALTRLWREARAAGTPPSASSAAQARERSGWSHVRWNGGARTIAFDCDGVRLDFGGIGKGLAATETLLAIERKGCLMALVSLDGDIACGAAPLGRAGWRVRVDSGVDGDAGCMLCIAHCAVSTSGDREQSMDVADEHITHIIDPAAGIPKLGRFAVTVVAPHGAIADALATAIAARPSLFERVDEMRAALGPFEARLVNGGSDSKERSAPRIMVTSGWQALVATDDQASVRSPAAAHPSADLAGTDPSDH